MGHHQRHINSLTGLFFTARVARRYSYENGVDGIRPYGIHPYTRSVKYTKEPLYTWYGDGQKLVRDWQEVIQTINDIFQVHLDFTPVTCILRCRTEELYSPTTYMALVRLLYLERKLIARYWLSSNIPTCQWWIQQVNNLFIKGKEYIPSQEHPLIN